MPKRNVRTSADALTADALIAAAKARGTTVVAVPDKARVALEKILAHNDAQPIGSRARVCQDVTMSLMQKLGWGVKSHHTLNAYCRRTLGRRSYATA